MFSGIHLNNLMKNWLNKKDLQLVLLTLWLKWLEIQIHLFKITNYV